MKLSDYMEEVVKECDDLRFQFSFLHDCKIVIDSNYDPVINGSGDCNYEMWNNGWLKKNIKEFNEAGYTNLVYVQELFPEPKEFVKFYKKARKNGEIDYLKGNIESITNEINELEQELENTINKLKELEGEE